jgi:hypothetical protein
MGDTNITAGRAQTVNNAGAAEGAPRISMAQLMRDMHKLQEAFVNNGDHAQSRKMDFAKIKEAAARLNGDGFDFSKVTKGATEQPSAILPIRTR